MTKTPNRSNLNRRVRSLLSKTEAAGCENGEVAVALEKAHNRVK